MESREQELFPHPSFREKQYETLKACLDAFDNGFKNVVLDAPTGTGKCIVEDSYVKTSDGLKKINEVEVGETVRSFDGTESCSREVSKKFKFNNVKTIKIETESGYVLEGTPDHRVRTIKNGELKWTEMQNLQNEYIVIDKEPFVRGRDVKLKRPKQNKYGRNAVETVPEKFTIDDSKAEFLGWFLGDGNIHGGQMRITCHKKQSTKIKKMVAEAWPFAEVNIEDYLNKSAVDVTINSSFITSILEDLCYEDSCKKIPNEIFGLGLSERASFIKGIFGADGTVGNSSITLSSKNKKILIDVQKILLSLGIVSQRQKKAGVYKGEDYYSWRLRVSGLDLDAFDEKIGEFYSNSQEDYSELVDVENRNTNKHILPECSNLIEKSVKQCLKNENIKDREKTGILKTAECYYYPIGNPRENPSVEMALKIAERCQVNINERDDLLEMASSDFYFDRVNAVEESEQDVYDINVPGTNCYTSDGFISHNSAVNTALLRYADNGYYTTPQKSLRQQIQDDDALEPYVEDLKARKDYFCNVGNDNCKDCSVYQSQDRSCAEQNAPPCNYWRRKQKVMNSDIAVITFSMMIIDGMIPVEVNGMQVSFDDRDMVVVDEAHGLVEQTREMHAGFDVTPYGLPNHIIDGVLSSVSWDCSEFSDVENELITILNRCENFVRDVPQVDMSDAEKRCDRLANKIQQAQSDVDNGNAWVVDVEGKQYGGEYVKTLEMRPIYVGNFLNNFVWSRADKRVISTATLRHRNNPDIWLKQVGLDPEETKVINVGMTFPKENRPVIKDEMVASMSSGGCDDNWDDIMDTLNDIAKRHVGKKGICHTASYNRASKVEETATKDEHPYLKNNIYIHTQDEDAEVAVEQWQDSDLDMIFSPSMMEGIDLDGESGRYNILMKVPYPPRNSWTKYLLNETDYGWSSYFDRAAIRVAQAYGRTNRSKEDFSNFYILDEDYEKLKKKTSLPKWLTEAEGYPEVAVRSVFDY